MPKVARISTTAPASTALAGSSENHPLVLIALFSGVGLLASLVAVIMGVPIVLY